MDDLSSTDLLHGVKAIGRFLGISKRQAQYWADSTDIPTFKVGRAVCARRSSLKAWIEARERAQRS